MGFLIILSNFGTYGEKRLVGLESSEQPSIKIESNSVLQFIPDI